MLLKARQGPPHRSPRPPASSSRLPGSAGRCGGVGAHHSRLLGQTFPELLGNPVPWGHEGQGVTWHCDLAGGLRSGRGLLTSHATELSRGPRRPVSLLEHLLSSFSAASLSHSISFFFLIVYVRFIYLELNLGALLKYFMWSCGLEKIELGVRRLMDCALF